MAIPSWYQAQIPTTISAPTKIINDIQHVMVSTIIGSTIQTNTLYVSSLSSSTIQTNALSIITLLGSTIQSNTFNVSTTILSTVQTNGLSFITVVGSTIQTNLLQYSTLIGCTIQTPVQEARIIIGSSIQTNTLNLSSLIGSSIQTNTAATSSLINSTILTPNLFVSSSLGSTIQTRIINISTLASDSIQLNNLYVSTLIGSTLVGSVFQINASNISSASGSTIQANRLQTNTLAGSTIQTNSFIASTINITGTNIIQMNTINVATAKGSTIICSTIQADKLGFPKSLVGIFGEYLTLDLGTSGNYHNQYSHWIRTYATVKKINFVGSNDGINWTNLGISAGTIVNVPGVGNRHFFNYTSTNVRYLRIIFIEIQNYSLYGFQLSFGESIISNDGESYGYSYSISLASLFPRSFDNISLSPNISLDSSYISNFTINVNGTYSPQSPYTTGYYNGNLSTMVPDPNSASYTIGILTTSTVQTNLLYSNNISGSTIQADTLHVSTLLGSTFINTNIQSNTLDVSSLIGGTIQMNTLLGNIITTSSIKTNQIGTSTLSGSTILMNLLNISTIICSSIQMSQIGVSTITRSTIQMNTLNANMNVITNTNFNISGEYITYDLGVSDVYHNRLTMYDYSNLGFAYLYKVHVIGSDDNNTWISLGVSIVTLLTDPNKFEYYYTLNNKRYLRLIILEVYNTVPDATYTKLYFNGGWVNYYNDPVAIANNQEIPGRGIYGVDVSPGLIIYRTEFISEYYIDSYLYSPTTYNTIGYYTGSLITNAASNINTITTTFANTVIGSTIQSDTISGGILQVSMLSGSTLIGSTIQIPQLTISTIIGSSIIGSNFQANKILITDGNKALSTSATNATQLLYISGLTSYAGGTGQINTWTSANTFTIAPIFTAVSTGTSLYNLGLNSGNQLIIYNQNTQSISGAFSINYIPYTSGVSNLTNSIIYRVNATDIAIGQITSTFPTGTGTTFSIVGLLQTTNLAATSGLFSKIIMVDKRSGLNGTVIPGNQGCNFYIGTMNNNGTGDLSDVLYLNSWADSTAGNINAVMFNKNTIGMRIYQGAVGAASNFTTYQDPVMTDVNSGNITLGQNSDTNGITFGPNTTWSSYLKVGSGTNRIDANVAQVISTNGNLHLDCATNSKGLYLNYYVRDNASAYIFSYTPWTHYNNISIPNHTLTASGNIYCNDWFRVDGAYGMYWTSYSRGFVSPEQAGNPYGNAATWGTGRNGWAGWGIGRKSCWMSNGTEFGIHDNDYSWSIYCSGGSDKFCKISNSCWMSQQWDRFICCYNGYDTSNGYRYVNQGGGTNMAQSSDERIKTGIKPIERNQSIAFINGIVPSYYCLKEATPCIQKKSDGTEELIHPKVCSCEQCGFIAQNVLESARNAGLPESTVGNTSDYEKELLLPEEERKSLLCINLMPIISHSVNVLKELIDQIDKQQIQINELQHQILLSETDMNDLQQIAQQQNELLHRLIANI